MKDVQKIKLTDEQKLTNIRDEYRVNIDLWMYDATFRQQRSETFLNINTALLVALSILVTINPSIRIISIVCIPLSLFGLLTCSMWRQVLLKNSAYMNFRRYQLRALEVQLQTVTTFRNQHQALENFAPLSIPGVDDVFQIPKSAKVSVIVIENRVPLLLVGLWSLILVSAIVILILSILGKI
jgi:hypothetical protein